MTRLLLAVAVAALSSVVAVAAPVPAAKKSQVLIVSARSGTANIYLHTDGDDDLKNLTDDKSNNSYPAWSPDGKRIAFSSDRDGGRMQVFVMDADGKNVKQLTSGDADGRVPSWTADGKTVAFCRRTPSGSQVCTVPAAGGDPTAIDADGDAWDPALSPDGKKVAFVSYRGGDGFRVYVMDADGKNVTKLTDDANPIGFGYPAWTPDGKTIAYGHHDGQGLDLYAVGAEGKDKKRLTKLGGTTAYPSFSPDGKRLAFFSQTSGDKGAYLAADADGGNQKELVKDEPHVEGGRPAWRPK